jgi:hypothetical protein
METMYKLVLLVLVLAFGLGPERSDAQIVGATTHPALPSVPPP